MPEQSQSTLSLLILRGAFLLLATTVTLLYVLGEQDTVGASEAQVMIVVLVVLGVVGSVIALDIRNPTKKLSAVSGVFLGLLVGLVLAYALSFFVDFIGLILPTRLPEASLNNLLQGVKIFIGLVTCYVGISLVLQTKDDFRFVIPYVEFAKEIRGNRPTLLDSSVLIDGRIHDLVQTHLLQGTLTIPRFILNELQLVADSSDKSRRARGRRGLDTVQKIQNVPRIDLSIDPVESEGGSIDQKLVSRALELRGRIMTNDHNLAKVAEVRGVEVILLNEVARALRPALVTGERMNIELVKPGEVEGQGVGYLEDGTMVVIDNAREHIGRQVRFEVTRIIQTTAGRMIFGKLVDQVDSDEPAPPAR
ncbi:MAG: hypothetical protein JJU36_11820 [Phycisphaeraceae bacterium]|nr:hypothetical protein [Phycisphaeraceae bacterium]